jgi:hypothetical protein
MRCAWVKIDTSRLTLRLWQLHGRWFSDVDLRAWLKDRGYNWRNGSWYTCDGPVNHLEADEVLETQTRVTEDGVTYVTRERPGLGNPSPAAE